MSQKILLVGTGTMAQEYAKVLLADKIPFDAVGRGSDKASAFAEITGVLPHAGGLKPWIAAQKTIPAAAIIAVDVPNLAQASLELIDRGVRRLLVEKPAGLNEEEVRRLSAAAGKAEAGVYVAYNRRYYASTRRAREIIAEDGGARSCHFDFTEWSAKIARTKHPPAVKEQWFFVNSTHVADLAFFLSGDPKTLHSQTSGSLPWHPAASIFTGSGLTQSAALFSYQANWEAPGRWGVEITTRKRRLILRPLEELYIHNEGSLTPEKAALDDADDKCFKPGLRRQLRAFLDGRDDGLLPIEDHLRRTREIFRPMVYPRAVRETAPSP
ncbi:MAG: hypothetical protein A3J74_03635 [Elusimicrobia bacterium RIFCSPHIGHO2_02_FULL_57_9]|nr:MAG: hypothetical protein A3J74_03635 [Elusimicrobia bacterium RIFCSPHIGHO2_02_FULL_57_9]